MAAAVAAAAIGVAAWDLPMRLGLLAAAAAGIAAGMLARKAA
jgi:hypothetical protein